MWANEEERRRCVSDGNVCSSQNLPVFFFLVLFAPPPRPPPPFVVVFVFVFVVMVAFLEGTVSSPIPHTTYSRDGISMQEKIKSERYVYQ